MATVDERITNLLSMAQRARLIVSGAFAVTGFKEKTGSIFTDSN